MINSESQLIIAAAAIATFIPDGSHYMARYGDPISPPMNVQLRSMFLGRSKFVTPRDLDGNVIFGRKGDRVSYAYHEKNDETESLSSSWNNLDSIRNADTANANNTRIAAFALRVAPVLMYDVVEYAESAGLSLYDKDYFQNDPKAANRVIAVTTEGFKRPTYISFENRYGTKSLRFAINNITSIEFGKMFDEPRYGEIATRSIIAFSKLLKENLQGV